MSRILLLSPMSHAGGGQRWAESFIDGMEALGNQVGLVFTRIGHRGAMFHFLLRRNVIDDLCYRYDDPNYPSEMGECIDTGYDFLVIDNDERLGEIWEHSSRLQNGMCKVIFVIHTENKPLSQIQSLVGKIWKLVCVSEKIAERFTGAAPIVIQNNFGETRSSWIDVRELMSIPNDARVIGYMGRIDDNKDPGFVIRVAKDTPLHVLIVGKGHVEIPSAMKDRVHVLPNEVAMPNDWYQAMDVYVLPSRSEGFPVAPIESLCAGTPVAMTRTSDYPKVFGKHPNIEFFDHGDVPGAVEAVKKMLRFGGSSMTSPLLGMTAASMAQRFQGVMLST